MWIPTSEQARCREWLPAHMRFTSENREFDLAMEMKAARLIDWLAREASALWVEYGEYEIRWGVFDVSIGVGPDQATAGQRG